MGTIVVLAIVAFIAIVVGFQSFIAAVVTAIVFALFLRYLTDEYFNFSYGLGVAGMSYLIAGILSIFIDVEFWGFWIAYIAVLLFWGFSLNRSVVKIEKEAQPVLKELQDFLEDYAHFMPDHDRNASFYWEGMGIQIKLWTWDAEIKRDIYRECDREHIDPDPVFFGEYKPISKRYYNCYMLLDKGTPAFGEDSLVYTWPFTVLGQKKYLFPVISNRMKDRYSGSFNGNKDMFTIRFDKTK